MHPQTGFVVTFDELYINELTVKDIAGLVHERNRSAGRRYPDKNIGDPSIKNRQASDKLSIQKHYAMEGIYIALGNNNIDIGVDKVTQYYKAGQRIITPNCRMLIGETARLRWKVYENARKRRDNNPRPEIHKKNDHAPDADRYFFADRPDLRLPVEEDLTPQRVNAKVQSILGSSRYVGGRVGFYDDNLRQSPVSTEWTAVDEHMGGYY